MSQNQKTHYVVHTKDRQGNDYFTGLTLDCKAITFGPVPQDEARKIMQGEIQQGKPGTSIRKEVDAIETALNRAYTRGNSSATKDTGWLLMATRATEGEGFTELDLVNRADLVTAGATPLPAEHSEDVKKKSAKAKAEESQVNPFEEPETQIGAEE